MTSLAQTPATQTTNRPGMPLSEFLRRSFQGERFEIIEGKVIPVSPTIAGHGYLVNFLGDLLKSHVILGNLGAIFVEMSYTTAEPDDPNWVTGSLTP